MNNEDQYKTNLLQERLKTKREDKMGNTAKKVGAQAAKTAAVSVGAVDPISQKTAAIAGKLAGEQIYKKRKKIILISICLFLFALLLFFLLFYLPFAYMWYDYCQGNLLIRGLGKMVEFFSGHNIPCP